MKTFGRLFITVLVAIIWWSIPDMNASPTNAHYWIDHDKLIEGTAALNGELLSLDIDVSKYPGAHTLYYRIQDLQGNWSAPICVPFISNPQTSGGSAKSFEYWIDKESTRRQTKDIADNVAFFDLNCEDLAPGAHNLYYRVEDQFGNFGSVRCHVFYKSPTSGGSAKSFEYWIDKDTDRKQKKDVVNNVAFFDLDCDDLAPGAHAIYYRFEDEYGVFGGVRCHVFYKAANANPYVARYRYWWNDRFDLAVDVDVDSKESVFTLDTDFSIPSYIADESNDSHKAYLNLLFVDNTENVSEIWTAEFDYESYLLDVDSTIADSSWRYQSNNGILTISNLTPGKGLVRIFSIDGRLLHASTPQYDTLTLAIPESAVIICHDGISRKVLLK